MVRTPTLPGHRSRRLLCVLILTVTALLLVACVGSEGSVRRTVASAAQAVTVSTLSLGAPVR
jgi:hypothetical protein